MKPLDFVKTPGGGIAIITEKNLSNNSTDGSEIASYSIEFIKGCNPNNEHNAWWYDHQLIVIDTLPQLLARKLVHPFGSGKECAINSFPI